MPPRLKAAWKDGITGRRSVLMRSTAALFIATLSEPYAAPKTSRTSPSAVAEWVSGGSTMLSAMAAAEAVVTAALPNRRHNRPVITMKATAPADTPSRASPSAPAPAPVCALIAGMRTTHPAKRKPSMAKNAVRAIRRRTRCGPVGAGTRRSLVRAIRILFSVGTKPE